MRHPLAGHPTRFGSGSAGRVSVVLLGFDFAGDTSTEVVIPSPVTEVARDCRSRRPRSSAASAELVSESVGNAIVRVARRTPPAPCGRTKMRYRPRDRLNRQNPSLGPVGPAPAVGKGSAHPVSTNTSECSRRRVGWS